MVSHSIPILCALFTRANLLEQQFKVEPRGEAVEPLCAKRDNAIGHRRMREVDRINIHGAAGEASEVGLGESADCRSDCLSRHCADGCRSRMYIRANMAVMNEAVCVDYWHFFDSAGMQLFCMCQISRLR